MDCDPKYLIEISSLEFTVFNRMVQFFSEYSISLFHERICGYQLLKGYCIYSRRALAAVNCVYNNAFDRYFYLRRIVISKEYLQLYI